MHGILFWVLVLIGLRLIASLTLSALNRAEVRRRRASPPEAVLAALGRETYAKAAEYTLAKSKFGVWTELFDAALLVALLTSGILPRIYAWVSGWSATSGRAVWPGATFIILVILASSLISLPFDAWEQFNLEAKFGFNRSTPGLWLADKLKGALLGLAIGVPLLWLLLALVTRVGGAWWIWAAALVFTVQLVMLIVYPRVILPLFNKLSPLPEGELRSRLVALGERTGFRAGAIEVIDGSKRSAHSNAYFTGFGRFRRVVLFDTLIAQLSAEELEAVLAHEIGHYRCGHIPRRIALSAVTLLAGFGVLAWLAAAPWFVAGFGFPPAALAPAFLLFGLLSGAATFWLTPLSAAWSRRHEFQADEFARQAMSAAAPMIGALRKLSEKNLSNPTPHPLFSAFYYSHPTAFEREQALLTSERTLRPAGL
jgi:STE24 endopeptidase